MPLSSSPALRIRRHQTDTAMPVVSQAYHCRLAILPGDHHSCDVFVREHRTFHTGHHHIAITGHTTADRLHMTVHVAPACTIDQLLLYMAEPVGRHCAGRPSERLRWSRLLTAMHGQVSAVVPSQ